MAVFNIGVTFGFAMMVLFQRSVAQTVHVVGDSIGWTVPQAGGAQAYITWASGKNFMVGDTLTFNFTTNNHDVLRVQKESFDACTSSYSIGDVISTGPVNITLDSTGEHYYICTIGGHCQSGQKLAITVSSRTTGASPPSTTPPPPPSPTATPPVPSSNNTSDGCVPTPAPSPTTIPSPPGSSSSNVLASFLMTMLAAIVGLVF
ncbi:hypothetical protein D5086_001746 [Populus alba]|uniref:Phytocyanin domain-containing protein n=3 Tax=Populus TaxID=3689 RepID=A0A4V6A1B7_POPAL|nr:cucumber peeling cupredoxin-like [Populus alba]KAG6792409.1 hypothetical protein POTOM_001557 [Populus tomentosa]TKR74925.1 hypothetical protein D5086_0000290290 [Populus alba]